MQSQIRAQSDTPHAGPDAPLAHVPRDSQRHRRDIVLLSGLLAGAFDLTFAIIFYGFQGAAPARQVSASGMGKRPRASPIPASSRAARLVPARAVR